VVGARRGGRTVKDARRLLSRGRPFMWLNLIFLIFASLCVGFILGWFVGRPRRWGAFVSDTQPADDDESVNGFVRRA
jgi:hypothetical protein